MDTSSRAGETPDLFMPVYASMIEGAWELRVADLVIGPAIGRRPGSSKG